MIVDKSDNQRFISIIIPVYNIEKWIPRCLESVLSALKVDGEVILVTGQSTDGSNALCDVFKEKDQRIQVIRQDGKGLANARNCGYDVSCGKYIVYIDGDDMIDSDLFIWLIERISALDGQFDVAMTDYQKLDIDGKVIENVFQIGSNTQESLGEGYLEHVLRRKKCFWNVWRYIYRREFLEQYSIKFLEGRLSEDMDYIARVWAARPRFSYFHCPYYKYINGRGDSLMDLPTLERLNDTIFNIKNGITYMAVSVLPYASSFIEQFQYEYILCMALCVEIDKRDRTKAYVLYRDTLDILNIGCYLPARIVKSILRILPISVGAWCLHFMKILKRRLRGDMRKTAY